MLGMQMVGAVVSASWPEARSACEFVAASSWAESDFCTVAKTLYACMFMRESDAVVAMCGLAKCFLLQRS